MIGKLTGLVDSQGEDHVILDVQGVGYIVFCSSRTLRLLPKPGASTALLIEMQVREDAIRLFGFPSEVERDWFRLLQSVQGVGAKVALALQGLLSATELAQAIALQDKASLGRAPGVGPKLAARLITELKDKMPALGPVDSLTAKLTIAEAEGTAPVAAQDAITALVNLGYGRPQAAAAVATSLEALGETAPLADLIRRGLKELAR
ncbi:Holliday junction branch migration protein RuvA [Beijerinckia indica]|uniref:Holliday junction branch migration complex subunit RuvA n=1 Tax=Beijerinckia indica subsp. indica (strain ATCC 9039 / DSM 1715 / NCIMB 8712) TaxID=395963 RepID=RUVA_BEII9|nr:Holliday junction branch migration protein RuvA [Beijerinckia indica]B2IAW4.1 RecName: Full=Holliday junction branch migration complex subunit RuvA [Beijerinckia indica subsp. indica ATCC 9039]ACB93664.1 Holliday junction DNA helicase RuvA [Beijerinckia indica subsp. indica ATCC 9039]